MRLFFEVERTIDTIAAAMPAKASELDSIKQQLRAILTSALQGATSTPPPTPGLIQGGAGELVR